MKRFPQDVDALMWTLAEDPDRKALDEFEARYPQFRAELGKRILSVRSLRASKPDVAFVARGKIKMARNSSRSYGRRRFALGWSLTALAGVALASLIASVTLRSPNSQPLPTSLINVLPSHPVAPLFPRRRNIKHSRIVTKNEEQTDTQAPNAPPASPNLTTQSSGKPVILQADGMKLSTAITLVASEAGFKVLLAPPFPDVTITDSFDGPDCMSVLKAMGVKYGFTAFDQGDGTIVVYPAVAKQQNPASATGKVGG